MRIAVVMLDTRRAHAVKFVVKDMSCHFIAFDSDVPLATRIEFLSAAGATLTRDSESPTLVELRSVMNEAHPAFGQLALHAKVSVPAKTVLAPYTGIIKVCKSITSSRTYAMGFGSVNDDLVIDAEFAGGVARFANDPRNTGRCPNAIAESRLSPLGEYFTVIVSKRTILEGEEILMDYGKAFAFDPLPWVVDGEKVSRPRLRGSLPVPSVGRLLRECSVCGAFVSREVADHPSSFFCQRCGTISTPQHARHVFAASSSLSLSTEVLQEESAAVPWWPQSVAFLPWQCWDPLIPVSQLSPHVDFRLQDGIKLYDTHGDVHVVSTRTYAPGESVCFVGGIATLREVASSNRMRRKTLALLPLQFILGFDRSVHLIVTNEAQFVTIGEDDDNSNVIAAGMQTSMGCPYVVLVAKTMIDSFERLVAADPWSRGTKPYSGSAKRI